MAYVVPDRKITPDMENRLNEVITKIKATKTRLPEIIAAAIEAKGSASPSTVAPDSSTMLQESKRAKV